MCLIPSVWALKGCTSGKEREEERAESSGNLSLPSMTDRAEPGRWAALCRRERPG